MKVLVTSKIPGIAEKMLSEKGYQVISPIDKDFNESEIMNFGSEVDGILCLLSNKFDAQKIDKFNRLKILSNYAVGYNNIDVEYARKKGIWVTNTPDVLTEATADIAISLMLMCARNLVQAIDYMKQGKFNGWEPYLFLGKELFGKSFGIIGAGRIGIAVAKRAKSFGMKINYFSRKKNEKFENTYDANYLALEDLLEKSDVISLHIPLTKETFHLLDREKLELMKSDAIIINTARGEVIDEKYLIKMLKEKRIYAAGFDVYYNEPNINEELFKLNNVVLLPHIGSATIETRTKMGEIAAKNIINVLSGKNPISAVN